MTEKDVLSSWKEISAIIAAEISENEAFAKKMEAVLGKGVSKEPSKKRNRRTPAKVNPYTLLELGEEKMAEELARLSIEELKDIVSEYGLDTTRRALKWKDRDKLEAYIIETTKRKASHGEAFWALNDTAKSD